MKTAKLRTELRQTETIVYNQNKVCFSYGKFDFKMHISKLGKVCDQSISKFNNVDKNFATKPGKIV